MAMDRHQAFKPNITFYSHIMDIQGLCKHTEKIQAVVNALNHITAVMLFKIC